jgi:DnaJ domain
VDSATAASLLGVPLDASRADIERAFRRRARQEHPDVAGETTEFAAVTQARDVLLRAQARQAPSAEPQGARHRVASAPRRGFELHPVALASLSGLLILGCVVEGIASTSPYAPIEPVLRSLFLVGSVVGYAVTRRRVFGVASAIAIVLTAAATIAWISFGALLGGAIMVPAVVLLMLHGRNRAL